MIRQALNNYKVASAELEQKAISGIRLMTVNILKAKRKA
jgi:hypothetical protein